MKKFARAESCDTEEVMNDFKPKPLPIVVMETDEERERKNFQKVLQFAYIS